MGVTDIIEMMKAELHLVPPTEVLEYVTDTLDKHFDCGEPDSPNAEELENYRLAGSAVMKAAWEQGYLKDVRQLTGWFGTLPLWAKSPAETPRPRQGLGAIYSEADIEYDMKRFGE